MFTAAAVSSSTKARPRRGHAEAAKNFCRGHRNNQSHKHIIMIRFKKKKKNPMMFIISLSLTFIAAPKIFFSGFS